MGCSIKLIGPRGKRHDITPGWPSKMHGLFERDFGGSYYGGIGFTQDDLEQLRATADHQCKGKAEPPFDWSQDIFDSFHKIIAQVEKHGSAAVEVVY